MELQGKLEQRHFVDLCKSVKTPDYPQHRRRLGLMFVSVFAGLIVAMTILPRLDLVSHEQVELSLLSFLCGALLSAVWSIALLRNEQSVLVREDGGTLGRRRFELNDTGIAVEGAHGHSLMRWSCITELTEAPHTFLLWTDPGAAIMVPKEAFADDAAREAFKALVIERIATGGAE